ncbi:MAG: hypothetical protein JWR00_896 [Rubritepida sp.]|nr:hypothetical protein [Rubritepida sp.]
MIHLSRRALLAVPPSRRVAEPAMVDSRMAEETVRRAAHNNAIWCDAVCATHLGPGEFHASHWLNRHGVPQFYPDFVTLSGSADGARQTEALAGLIEAAGARSLFVKDSFDCLRLQPFGFHPLFRAEWLSAPALGSVGRQEAAGVRWLEVVDDRDLTRWERAWSGSADEAKPRMFRPGLLAVPGIRFVYGLVHSLPVGGGILAASSGVTGLSNVFARGIATEVVLQGLAQVAAASFPGQPLTDYEHGDDLVAAHRVGFQTVGRLRVWHRPAPGR